MRPGPKQIVGNRYGRWTVISVDSESTSHMTKYMCICDCGKTGSVFGTTLTKGQSKSCGCYRRDAAIEKTYINLIGERFNRLTVLSEVRENGMHVGWRCRCSCGNETTTRRHDLINGLIKSCGCYKNELVSKRLLKNLKGMVFGRLTVLNNAGLDKWGRYNWKCLCECGEESIVSGRSLLSGKTKSCGCLRREMLCFKSGEKSASWKGGVTPENNRIRKSLKGMNWKNAIFERDDYTCRICNKRGGILHAHHIYKFSDFEELRFLFWNGLTLCPECHDVVFNCEHEYVEYFMNMNIDDSYNMEFLGYG